MTDFCQQFRDDLIQFPKSQNQIRQKELRDFNNNTLPTKSKTEQGIVLIIKVLINEIKQNHPDLCLKLIQLAPKLETLRSKPNMKKTFQNIGKTFPFPLFKQIILNSGNPEQVYYASKCIAAFIGHELLVSSYISSISMPLFQLLVTISSGGDDIQTKLSPAPIYLLFSKAASQDAEVMEFLLSNDIFSVMSQLSVCERGEGITLLRAITSSGIPLPDPLIPSFNAALASYMFVPPNGYFSHSRSLACAYFEELFSAECPYLDPSLAPRFMEEYRQTTDPRAAIALFSLAIAVGLPPDQVLLLRAELSQRFFNPMQSPLPNVFAALLRKSIEVRIPADPPFAECLVQCLHCPVPHQVLVDAVTLLVSTPEIASSFNPQLVEYAADHVDDPDAGEAILGFLYGLLSAPLPAPQAQQLRQILNAARGTIELIAEDDAAACATQATLILSLLE